VKTVAEQSRDVMARGTAGTARRTTARFILFLAYIKMYGIISSKNTGDLIYQVIIFLLFVAILTFVLRFLWNSILVKHITILRPVETLVDTFLLSLGIAMFKL
jgi:hypothetical protein